MSSITLTFAIVVAIVVLFVWNRIPVVLVALGTALALYFTGVTNLQESLGGLGDPAVIFIASLFVVSTWPRCHRRDRLGGTGTDRPVRTKPCPAARSHDVAGCRADRIDQRQRSGRRTAAGDCGHGNPSRSCSLATAHAAGLLSALRIAPGTHRHAGERARVGSSNRGRAAAVRLLLVRGCRHPFGGRNHSDRGAVRATVTAGTKWAIPAIRS